MHHMRTRVALNSLGLRESIVNNKWVIEELMHFRAVVYLSAYHRVSFILITNYAVNDAVDIIGVVFFFFSKLYDILVR